MTDYSVLESPIEMIEGEVLTFSVTWLGASSLSSPDAKVYKDNSDITSTAMASGAHSVAGNVQTLKPLTAGTNDGGKTYVVVIQCSVDSNVEKRKLLVNILKDQEAA